MTSCMERQVTFVKDNQCFKLVVDQTLCNFFNFYKALIVRFIVRLLYLACCFCCLHQKVCLVTLFHFKVRKLEEFLISSGGCHIIWTSSSNARRKHFNMNDFQHSKGYVCSCRLQWKLNFLSNSVNCCTYLFLLPFCGSIIQCNEQKFPTF